MPIDQEAERAPGDRLWSVGLLALLVVPLVVSAVYLWFSVGTAYLPTTDWAIFELRVRDVLHHAVFVGPYSRYGWNHPGPLLFYVLAGPYKLLGSRSISIHITALLVNALTLGAIAWVAFRRGRLLMVVAVLVPVGLLTHAVGADFLRNPWNPYLPVLPLLLLVLLVWSVVVGDLWMAPIAVAVASFTIQSHVGLALDSVALLLVGLVGLVARGVRQPHDERRAWWLRTAKVLAVALGVGIVLWLPTLYGTLVKGDGNLGAIFDFFTDQPKTAGFGAAIKALGLQWGPKPEWIFGPRGSGILGNAFLEPNWWLAIWLVLAGGATAIAVWRRAFDVVWLTVVVGVGLIAAVVAASNVVGIMFAYVIQWTWVFGVGLGIIVLRGLWLLVPPARRPVARRWVVPIAAAVLAVLSVMETVDALNAGTPFARQQIQEQTIDREVLAKLPRGTGPVLIDGNGGGLAVPGLALALERRGIPVQITPNLPVIYGAERAPHGGPYRAVLTVVVGDDTIRAFHPPGPRIAHFVRPRTAATNRALAALLALARDTPPGAERDQILDLVRQVRNGPAEEVAVYLSKQPA